jgi:hypothetical protein
VFICKLPTFTNCLFFNILNKVRISWEIGTSNSRANFSFHEEVHTCRFLTFRNLINLIFTKALSEDAINAQGMETRRELVFLLSDRYSWKFCKHSILHVWLDSYSSITERTLHVVLSMCLRISPGGLTDRLFIWTLQPF